MRGTRQCNSAAACSPKRRTAPFPRGRGSECAGRDSATEWRPVRQIAGQFPLPLGEGQGEGRRARQCAGTTPPRFALPSPQPSPRGRGSECAGRDSAAELRAARQIAGRFPLPLGEGEGEGRRARQCGAATPRRFAPPSPQPSPRGRGGKCAQRDSATEWRPARQIAGRLPLPLAEGQGEGRRARRPGFELTFMAHQDDT